MHVISTTQMTFFFQIMIAYGWFFVVQREGLLLDCAKRISQSIWECTCVVVGAHFEYYFSGLFSRYIEAQVHIIILSPKLYQVLLSTIVYCVSLFLIKGCCTFF